MGIESLGNPSLGLRSLLVASLLGVWFRKNCQKPCIKKKNHHLGRKNHSNLKPATGLKSLKSLYDHFWWCPGSVENVRWIIFCQGWLIQRDVAPSPATLRFLAEAVQCRRWFDSKAWHFFFSLADTKLSKAQEWPGQNPRRSQKRGVPA